MINIIFGFAIAAFSLTSCNNSNSKIAENQNAIKDTVQVNLQVDTSITPTPIVADAKATVTIKEIISTYLQMKNAFAKDNSNDAATAGKSLQAAFINFDTKTLSAQQAKNFYRHSRRCKGTCRAYCYKRRKNCTSKRAFYNA